MELSYLDECVLWGNQVVIPAKCHGAVLDSFHKSHPGIIRIKALARNSVTMVPGIDDDLEKHVNHVN